MRRSPRLEIPRGDRVGFRYVAHRGREFIIPLYRPVLTRSTGFDVFGGRYFSAVTGAYFSDNDSDSTDEE